MERASVWLIPLAGWFMAAASIVPVVTPLPIPEHPPVKIGSALRLIIASERLNDCMEWSFANATQVRSCHLFPKERNLAAALKQWWTFSYSLNSRIYIRSLSGSHPMMIQS
jgi:hypothetical protein